jgi:hypothetical protein
MLRRQLWWIVLLLLAFCHTAFAQVALVRSAPRHDLPTHIDGNSSLFWVEDKLHMYSSTGNPIKLSIGSSPLTLTEAAIVDTTRMRYMSAWMEAAWRDEDGTVYSWYHHEPSGSCPGDKDLTIPAIGAAVSYDNGRSVEDLGLVLESGHSARCDARNGFFAGGHGDFSVVLDRKREYFYFFFTNYSGPDQEQGVCLARLAFADRANPVGRVQKYFQGEWLEPGLGGHTTPVYPTFQNWQRENTDSWWGPSTHWNTHLEKYVVLLNRVCCSPGWPQRGIYVAFVDDLEHPENWVQPAQLMHSSAIGHHPGYYPQVIGLEPGGTDTLAGQTARLYIHGFSNWEISFEREGQMTPETPFVPPPDQPSPNDPQTQPALPRKSAAPLQ